VNEKVLFSFSAENGAGRDEWSGRKLMRMRVELNRNEAFGYERLNADALRPATGFAQKRP